MLVHLNDEMNRRKQELHMHIALTMKRRRDAFGERVCVSSGFKISLRRTYLLDLLCNSCEQETRSALVRSRFELALSSGLMLAIVPQTCNWSRSESAERREYICKGISMRAQTTQDGWRAGLSRNKCVRLESPVHPEGSSEL